MNYVPVTTGTISIDSAGTSEENSQDCIVMPIWKDTSYFDSPIKDVDNGEPKTVDDAQKQIKDGPNNENTEQERKNFCNLNFNRFGYLRICLVERGPLEQNGSSEIKKDERGIVIRNKARLVAHGHRQEKGIDYEEVFAPVARIEAIRFFFGLCFFYGFSGKSNGCKECFSYNGTIKKEVYFTQPPGFKDPDQSRQSLQAMGFKRAKRSETLYIKKQKGIFCLYRPDIMFAVCACARFQVTPKTSHLLAVKRIFRYLKGKPTLGLWYSRDSPFELVTYTDSDYAGATQDRKFTTGGCQFLGNMLISWQCKKQTVVANSTTEAEYVATGSCCGQVKQMRISDVECFTFEEMFEKSKATITSKEVGTPKIPQLVVPLKKVSDEAVHKELDDRMERAATTASSLEAEQGSSNIK
ncbi:uncharacterized mitochondrial protein-like protein [Tanacetum coccineum]